MDRPCLRIDVLTDTPTSWIHPWADRLAAELAAMGHSARRIGRAADLSEGDIAFLLSCERIVSAERLARHRCNLVCHPSDLPRGRGWSPLAWQVLEGASLVPVTLFEATERLDDGPIHDQEFIRLGGHELNEEIKRMQGDATVRLCHRFVAAYPDVSPRPQQGEPTWYRRRTAADSELDPARPIADQFDLLRVVDNERYPAFFRHRGHEYVLRIEKRAAPSQPGG